MAEVTALNTEVAPPAADPSEEVSLALAVISQWRKILNARLLALFALLGALAAFGCAIIMPDTQRLIGASLYAVGVLWPVMALFLRKG